MILFLEKIPSRDYNTAMTPEIAFKIANTVGLLAWIYLIAAARWTPRIFRVVRWSIVVVFAIAYIAALFAGEKPEGANFTTLDGVMALFTSPWGVVTGWIHYLAFDFFVGCWILSEAKKRRIPHWWIVVPLFFTFMFGPVGLLMFLAILGFLKVKQNPGYTS